MTLVLVKRSSPESITHGGRPSVVEIGWLKLGGRRYLSHLTLVTDLRAIGFGLFDSQLGFTMSFLIQALFIRLTSIFRR